MFEAPEQGSLSARQGDPEAPDQDSKRHEKVFAAGKRDPAREGAEIPPPRPVRGEHPGVRLPVHHPGTQDQARQAPGREL